MSATKSYGADPMRRDLPTDPLDRMIFWQERCFSEVEPHEPLPKRHAYHVRASRWKVTRTAQCKSCAARMRHTKKGST